MGVQSVQSVHERERVRRVRRVQRVQRVQRERVQRVQLCSHTNHLDLLDLGYCAFIAHSNDLCTAPEPELTHLGRVDTAGLRAYVCPGNRGDPKLRILDF